MADWRDFQSDQTLAGIKLFVDRWATALGGFPDLKQVANPKGSINGIKLQVWATWLVYAVLLDLGDAVAEELALPFDRISLEMVFRGLYHFHHAYSQGLATDPVQYLSAPSNRDLGVVKAVRQKKGQLSPKLDFSPYPVAFYPTWQVDILLNLSRIH